MKKLDLIALWIVVGGSLNWGAVLFESNLVDMVLGVGSPLSKVIYALVGASAIYTLVRLVNKFK